MVGSDWIARLSFAIVLCSATCSQAQQVDPAATTRVAGPPLARPEAGLLAPLWTPGRPPTADRRVTFRSIPHLYGPGQIQLSGGATVDGADLAAVAFGGAPDESCTLTLIGPKAVILAAHCVDAGWPPASQEPKALKGEVRFPEQPPHVMSCEISPAYTQQPLNTMGAPRSPLDYALCELDRPVANVSPESISTAVISDGPFKLMGFGCFNLRITAQGLYAYDEDTKPPKLRLAQDSVEARDVAIHPGQPGAYIRTLSTSSNEPVICYGDSGGPVMLATADGQGRRVVAVNSGFGATPDASVSRQHFYSYLSPLSSLEFRRFLEAWAGPPGSIRRIVCGYNRNAGIGGCRQ